MSDPASRDSNIRERKRSLAWITAASATHLELGLTAEQRICLYRECLAVAQEHSDEKVIGLCTSALNTLDDHIMSDFRKSTTGAECEDKEDDMTTYMILAIGYAHLEKEEYDDVILNSKRCLAMAQASGEKVVEMKAYEMLGDAHLKKEEYDDAISYGTKCLAIAQASGKKVVEMKAYMMLGDAHLKKEEYDDAISYGTKCLAIAQESGHKVAEMNAYKTLLNAHFEKEEYDNIISYSKKYLPIVQEFGIKVNEMNAYKILAVAHMDNQEYDDSISYSKKCLAIAQESGNKTLEMFAYMMLGNAHLKKEEYDNIISYSTKYLTIAQACGEKVVEMKAYMMLGVSHLKKEEYDDVISYGTKCLNIAQESGEKEEEMNAYIMLGNAHSKKEEYDDAHSFFTEAETIARELEDNHKVSHLGIRINEIYEIVGVSEGHSELSSLLKTFLGSVQKNESLFHSFFRFLHYKENDKYEEAISCLEDFMAHGKNSINEDEYRELLWTCNLNISKLHVLLKEYDKGIQYQQEALDVARKQGSKSKQAMSHFILGKVYYKLKQFENAEKPLKESLRCYELIFVGLKQNDRFKIAFIDKYKETFKLLLKVLIERNKKEEALVLSDQYRAKALKDLLVSSYGMKKEQTADEDLQYADVQSLVSSSDYTLLFYSTCFDELYTFVVEAGNELGFSVQHFEYCDTCLDKLVDETFEDMKVRQVIHCEDRSLDNMHYSEENKNPKEDELTQLLIQQREKRLSEQCRSTCVCRGNPSENCDESSLTSGLEKLYQKLINNIKFLIKQDEMVIIPEGPLCRLPFAALRDPDTGQYLSETKRIRMAPSIASLKFLQEYPVEHHSRNEALIIGGGSVDPGKVDGVKTEFIPLEGAEEEAKGIANMLGVQPLLSANATKPVVIKRLQEGASVVHIAAHGNLEKATIVLAPSSEIRKLKRIPDEEDYMLTMADVQQTHVRAQLVVLSCCESGRGEIKAEGVVGMCRAFLASGARAVVGSLWKINDKATCEFMVKFYKYLKDGKSASTSLNLTMKDMRRTPQYSEPKYWAPFFLMGDDVTIQFKD
ncbi:tetratricopeptide repeat protein 28-like [Actinia tenebrosa]|uniref:Tetratricopeptide repeat protein 28-like n=1 Tax=Actinia tenebrosa TaxID=6105 RepID=A0A6P8J5D0_ACTTE|nr:tetratricopeptide repeat protein 28-like [Actinia tenebrosa]XP_031574883.1 tetratricopeptide repeat protein 28-like [Actinia tenebrosa]XP_031574884.1 tetratricopeptide repeat protein 28-like [Actinia tenebrosa]XP_031574885.1 tetratricopeptide repeat protein 28-like [Actinia tenebrosa]XP_031574886.1 tetratricopeptide repeat protein 28-like [Actinia tenebrosa]